MSVFAELTWRGQVYDRTEGLEEHLAQGKVTLYIGFDPTAASLHVGNLLQIMNMARMQRAGHSPIAVVGGGTGLIGDPSGKSTERDMLTAEKVAQNLVGIRQQLSQILDFESPSNPARIIDNAEWLTTIPTIDFLRDIGKHFTVNYMLAKESVSRRLAQEEGISFTEFSYLLLQSYDFLELNRRYGCTLQMGGSDQWGNITAGTELIRRVERRRAHGLVCPLVTTSSGQKFGKTEAGAIWLDAARTSPYRFYQFWLNTSDSDVVNYLKSFTYLDQDEIGDLEQQLSDNPSARAAQRRLAADITERVHGPTALERAEASARILFGEAIDSLEVSEILDIFEDVPSSSLTSSDLEGGLPIPDLLVRCGVTDSKGAAKRLLRDGGIYLNNHRVDSAKNQVSGDDFLGGRVLIIRRGQKKYHLVTRQED